MTVDLNTLLETDDDVRRLFEGRPMQYRKSKSLPDLTWQAQSTCDRINRVFFEDQDEAMRLFHDLVPGAGDGVDFRPPINLDYGIGLTIGDRTFINKDFLIVGGGYVEIGPDCLIGPRCTICTPNHALDAATRLDGWEHTTPVRIGSNVWLGANVTSSATTRSSAPARWSWATFPRTRSRSAIRAVSSNRCRTTIRRSPKSNSGWRYC